MRRDFLKLTLIGVLTLSGGFAGFAEEKPQETVKIEGDEKPYLKIHTLGDENAPVTIEEYASFTCIHCGNLHETVMPEIKKNYIETGKAKLVYYEVYMDGPGVLAGSLARCAPEDRYFDVLDMLYKGQKEWVFDQKELSGVIENLHQYGRTFGLDEAALQKCLDDRVMQQDMLDTSEARVKAVGLEGTPLVLVNGKEVSSWELDAFSATLDQALLAVEK